MSKRMKGEMVMIGIVLAFALMILPGSALSAAKEPIRIGFISPVSGTFAADGEFMRNGFAMYLEKVNYEVAGRKIEVIDEDDKTDPRTGLIKAQAISRGEESSHGCRRDGKQYCLCHKRLCSRS